MTTGRLIATDGGWMPQEPLSLCCDTEHELSLVVEVMGRWLEAGSDSVLAEDEAQLIPLIDNALEILSYDRLNSLINFLSLLDQAYPDWVSPEELEARASSAPADTSFCTATRLCDQLWRRSFIDRNIGDGYRINDKGRVLHIIFGLLLSGYTRSGQLLYTLR